MCMNFIFYYPKENGVTDCAFNTNPLYSECKKATTEVKI